MTEYNPDYPEPHEEKQMTLVLNGREYALNEKFKNHVERMVESAYGENQFLEYYWDIQNGDPVVCIETDGVMVPWEQLSEFQFEVEQFDDDDSDDPQTTDTDNGNGVKTVDRDDVDMDDEELEEFKMTMTPQHFRPIPDPQDGEYATWPHEMEEYDEELGPIVNMPTPENLRDERWETGRAMVPMSTNVVWNIQKRADSTYNLPGDYDPNRDRSDLEGPAPTDSHDDWEWLCRGYHCDVVGKVKPKNTPTEEESEEEQSDPYDQEDMGGKYQGNNWNV